MRSEDPHQTTHNSGAIMGDDPKTSAVNRYLQSWDMPNVFIIGASAFPHNATLNPADTAGALDAIKYQYLKASGPLVLHA